MRLTQEHWGAQFGSPQQMVGNNRSCRISACAKLLDRRRSGDKRRFARILNLRLIRQVFSMAWRQLD